MNLLASIRRLLVAMIVLFCVGSAATSSTRTASGAYNKSNTMQHVSIQAAPSSQALSLLAPVTSLFFQSVLVNSCAASELALVQGSASRNGIEERRERSRSPQHNQPAEASARLPSLVEPPKVTYPPRCATLLLSSLRQKPNFAPESSYE